MAIVVSIVTHISITWVRIPLGAESVLVTPSVMGYMALLNSCLEAGCGRTSLYGRLINRRGMNCLLIQVAGWLSGYSG